MSTHPLLRSRRVAHATSTELLAAAHELVAAAFDRAREGTVVADGGARDRALAAFGGIDG
ncbi:hypothetical protein HJ588_16995 [Flexivirga sp. ID2601S]|uniref:Uncharacterized protein n=1 Tax=Flexivirga aerilata TaxID=1656889 RepID=A0A849ANS1_9MICO|nr:hypothetical protein [Flexivirga aerilata]NNG40958.1 hypothetical protein [Flexivirga aerilata]